MNLIFGNDGGGDGLLMRAPLKTLFWDFGVGESKKCESTCSKYEGDYLMELSLCVSLTFLGASLVLIGSNSGIKSWFE